MEKIEKSVTMSFSDSISRQKRDILSEMTKNPLPIKVCGNYILVYMFDVKPEEKTRAGIYVTVTDKKADKKEYNYTEHYLQGIIIGVGDEEKWFKPGEHVFMIRESRSPVMINKRWYIIVTALDIALIVR